MKNILILVMSCQDEFYKNEERLIDETWGKDIIEGKYPNISLYKYAGGFNIPNITEDNFIAVNTEDDINNTFKKTFVALSLCKNYLEYDYIFRVNTSTYVNVPLLNAFVQTLNNPDDLWCSELYSLSEHPVPYPLMLFGRGNALLLSKKLVQIILDEGFPFLYLKTVDDSTIGNILNSHWLKEKEDYTKHLHCFRHGWYKCIGGETMNNHSECNYNNEDCSFDFMKDFITIQIKRYWEREKEHLNYIDLYEKCFSCNEDDNIVEAVKKQYEYDKNPNIFIGSILGYVKYSDWRMLDRKRLYDLEVNNKSIDDINRGRKDILLF